MAENKKSFLLYADLIETFEALSDEDAGQLVKHLLRYVNDQDPETENPMVKVAFIPIKQTLKRDLEKYKAICERNKANGSKGGRPKKEEPKKPIGLYGNPSEPKKADSDNDNDSDNEILNKTLLSEADASDPTDIFIATTPTGTVKPKQKKNYLEKTKMSEVILSDVPEELQEYFTIAEGFRKLFIRHLKERDSPTTNQEDAKFKAYVDPIRLLIEKENASLEQIRRVYSYIASDEGDFWKTNVLSTSKLREKFQQLSVKSANVPKTKPTKHKLAGIL